MSFDRSINGLILTKASWRYGVFRKFRHALLGYRLMTWQSENVWSFLIYPKGSRQYSQLSINFKNILRSISARNISGIKIQISVYFQIRRDCFKRGLNARTCTLWFTSTFVILPPPKYSPHNNLPITQCLLQRSEVTNENLAPPLKPQNLWTLAQRFLSLKSFFFDFEWAFRRLLKRNGVFQSLQVLHAFIDNNSNAKAKLSIQANLFCNPATDTTTAKH